MPYKTETYTVYNPVFDQSKYRNSSDAARHNALTWRNEVKTRQVWYDEPVITTTKPASSSSSSSPTKSTTPAITNPFIAPADYNAAEKAIYLANSTLANSMYTQRKASEVKASQASTA